MAMIQSRRRLLGGMALAVPAALAPLRRAAAVEPPPETRTVRFSKHPVICFALQYVCEELLRAEGFTDIRWVDIPIAAALLAVMISALFRWPDKIVAGVSIPTAFLIAFVAWRERW